MRIEYEIFERFAIAQDLKAFKTVSIVPGGPSFDC